MGTRGPVLVESGGGAPWGLFLMMIIIGIIGITVWLAWMYFKSQNKNVSIGSTSAPSRAKVAGDALLTLRRGIAGDWEIYVNGQRYRSLEAVPEDSVRQDVVKGIKALANFARKYIQKGQNSASVPTPAQTASPMRPATTGPEFSGNMAQTANSANMAQTANSAVVPPDLAARLSRPSQPVSDYSMELPMPTASTSTAPTDTTRTHLTAPALKRSSTPAMFMPTINLAEEIGEIVDTMLALSPTLCQRSIKLVNSMSGGVDFIIDGHIYDDIFNIPDADVKRLIQTAIKEWERRK